MDQKYHLFYELAYNLAQVAYNQDEVPVGAVIIRDSTFEVISSSYNQMKQNRSSIDHAEILALKIAMARLDNERLNGCSMIITLEPCPMCAQNWPQYRHSWCTGRPRAQRVGPAVQFVLEPDRRNCGQGRTPSSSPSAITRVAADASKTCAV